MQKIHRIGEGIMLFALIATAMLLGGLKESSTIRDAIKLVLIGTGVGIAGWVMSKW